MLPSSPDKSWESSPATEPRRNQQQRTLSPLQRRLAAASAVVVLLTSFSGCSTFSNGFNAMLNNGAWNDTVVSLRNRSFSAKAWHRRKHHFCNEKHNKDFCAGFRAGYEAVAIGGDGCTPSFPPQEYWSWEFQSGEGQARTSAWFAGFPHGARAAEEDGVSNWSQLQMSAGLQAQYQQCGTFEHDGALYPIPAGPTQTTPLGGPRMTPEEIEMLDLPPGAQLVPNQSDVPIPTVPRPQVIPQ